MTLDCVIPIQSSVIQTIHRNVGLECFFSFTKMFVIIVMYAYFIDISQGSVEAHLRCGGIYNNHYRKLSAECASESSLKIGQ